MIKTIFFLITCFFYLNMGAQNFEGKVTYKNSFKSKIASVKDEQLEAMLGSKEEFYIKNGDYKILRNGLLLNWMLYVRKDNKVYSKLSNTDTLYWDDAAMNEDEIVKTELNKGVIEILGHKCDELVITCKKGFQKHYFNSQQLKTDPDLFVSHKYICWYDYLLNAKALPLKSIIHTEEFVFEIEALSIQEMKLEKDLFELPANSKLKKSSYK